MHIKTTRVHIELGMVSLRHGALVCKLSVLKLFVLKLLARKNKALLIRWYALHIPNLLLHILNGVVRLHLESDRFAGKHLHKSLHIAARANAGPSGASTSFACYSLLGFAILNPAITPHNLRSSHCALSVHSSASG